MAIKTYETFAPRANLPDSEFIYGSIKNETIPGVSFDGTPLNALWGNDYVGFTDALLAEASIVPNSLPDTALKSQRLDAIISLIFNLRYKSDSNYIVGTKVVGSDGETYHCLTPNGIDTVVKDPVTEAAPRVYWLSEDARAFDKQHPVGTYYSSEANVSPVDFIGSRGTWLRVKGRGIIGLDEADPSFDTSGATGGSKNHGHSDTFSVGGHSLTAAENGPHNHDYIEAYDDGPTTGANDPNSRFTSFRITSTSVSGSGALHDHPLNGSVSSTEALPPYIVAYIWKRTA